jgi:hypothetical protein
MSYGGHYPGGASPSFANQQLPGAGYQQGQYGQAQQSPYVQTAQAYARAYSPQPGAAPPLHSQMGGPPAATPQPQIQPGQVTYTTSTGPDGQLIYHCFR